MNPYRRADVVWGVDTYLLPRRSGEYILYAGELEAPARERPKASEAEPDSTAKKLWTLSKDGYDRLTWARRQREALLRSLGARESVRFRIRYPSSLTQSEARAIYDELIAKETEKHKKWMIASTAGIPLAIPLTLIPGPNVLLAYLAWRSVAHYKTKKAGERASELEVELVPDERLDGLAKLVKRWPFRARRRIREVGETLGLAHLDRVF